MNHEKWQSAVDDNTKSLTAFNSICSFESYSIVGTVRMPPLCTNKYYNSTTNIVHMVIATVPTRFHCSNKL